MGSVGIGWNERSGEQRERDAFHRRCREYDIGSGVVRRVYSGPSRQYGCMLATSRGIRGREVLGRTTRLREGGGAFGTGCR